MLQIVCAGGGGRDRGARDEVWGPHNRGGNPGFEKRLKPAKGEGPRGRGLESKGRERGIVSRVEGD